MNGIKCMGKARPRAWIRAFLVSLRWSIIGKREKCQGLLTACAQRLAFISDNALVGNREARFEGVNR
ncbi:hypothetical protein QCE49_32740 [Caballeronia sp. LZ008]|uniref:hypothetical protein n=1 Tax=unclassified Caballeronia TaxID=2646786 RepID=UPI002028C7C3|nr:MULTISPECIES: hypothetical protein [unclassified Caballeronia]MDR5798168.1 hypothetical protein [Caballeronia sp. LZ008]